jgi:cold shock CspA family protein
MQTKLKFAVSAARACARFLYEEGAKEDARDIAEWLATESMQRFGGIAPSIYTPILRRGTIRELRVAKGFGFIVEGKTTFFFHRSQLRDQAVWSRLKAGSRVIFETDTDQQGRTHAVRVSLEAS